MASYPIYQLDAFTTRRFAGNPAAVVVVPAFPDDAVLLSIAAENNLSETAFLVAHQGQYRLRWFTPSVEVPLCGHATLASAAVVMQQLEPGTSEVVFDTRSGPLPVRSNGNAYVLDFPQRVARPIAPLALLSQALGLAPLETLDDGYSLMAVLPDADAVRNLTPDVTLVARLPRNGLIVTAPGEAGFDCVSRYFAPNKGVPEDPVTGSAHCALGPYWAARLGKRELRACQASARGGELICRLTAPDRIELEGNCAFYLEGRITV